MPKAWNKRKSIKILASGVDWVYYESFLYSTLLKFQTFWAFTPSPPPLRENLLNLAKTNITISQEYEDLKS